MSDFLLFLGRFHVVVLHLPIGMVLLTAIVHWLSRSARHNSLQQVLPVLWAFTALSALVTVVLGLLHFGEGGFSGPSVNAHRLWGIGFALAVQLVWFLSVFNVVLYQRWGGLLCAALLIAVTITGHYGGNLTHGPTYLVEYAPQSIRQFAGLDERRAPVTDLALADPWHDVIAPMLQSRCGSCHNPDKQRGQLDLSSLDALLVGGESGAVVLPGNAEGSDLYKRVTLPESHENFMPAEGKTPLTQEQVQILGWWLDAGLPAETSVSALSVDEETTALLSIELGLSPVPVMVAAENYPALPEEMINQMVASGWLVRPLSRESNGLSVSINAIGQPASRDMLALLNQASASMVELNLASTGLNDDLLAVITDMPVLEILNLSNNGITDAGLDTLAGFENLQVLNLYGNSAITDGGLEKLVSLVNLETLYLWGTAVSEAGLMGLQASMVDLEIYAQALPR